MERPSRLEGDPSTVNGACLGGKNRPDRLLLSSAEQQVVWSRTLEFLQNRGGSDLPLSRRSCGPQNEPAPKEQSTCGLFGKQRRVEGVQGRLKPCYLYLRH